MANGLAGAPLGFLCGRSTTASSSSSSMAVERTTSDSQLRYLLLQPVDGGLQPAHLCRSGRNGRKSWWCCEWIGGSPAPPPTTAPTFSVPSARRPSSFACDASASSNASLALTATWAACSTRFWARNRKTLRRDDAIGDWSHLSLRLRLLQSCPRWSGQHQHKPTPQPTQHKPTLFELVFFLVF